MSTASYAAAADLEARYPMRDLIQLTNEDPTAVTVNETYLATFLADAADEIDAHLESRFALPFSNPPEILKRICCDIAMYHLQGLRPIHDLEYSKQKYEQALKFLDEVSEGQLTLGLSSGNEEPADPSSPAVVTVENFGGAPELPQRIFSRGKLIGY